MSKRKNNQELVFETVWAEALRRGNEAANAVSPRPMLVEQRVNPLDDNSPVVQQYRVDEGVCGFAWVNIRPATSAFARWLKKNGLARPDSYEGGIVYWVSQFGQSMERKEAFADAMAAYLRQVGYRCSARSRMD
jgi:hypothetical protein